MSKEATGQFGARIGSSAYWIRINHAAGLRDLMGSEPEYHAILQRVGSRASAAIEEIYDDLANQGSKIRYISSSNRNALAKQVVGLYDVCKMTGTSASHSSDCIYALNMSALSLWNNPFRDERAIDKAISIINRQSHYSSSEAVKILEEGSKWSISFVAGSDTIKKAFLESVLQGKNNSFLQDVANEYQHRNTIQHFTGKCGYEIGSRAYLEHFESQVFGSSLSSANSATFGNPDYDGLLRDALRSVADQLEHDLDEATRQNDYITDNTADALKEVVNDLHSCGISTGSIHGKIDKLAWFVGGDPHAILSLQRNLNKIGYGLTEDGVFGAKTNSALNKFFDDLVWGSFPIVKVIDPLQSSITNIAYKEAKTFTKETGEIIYASLHDTSARSHNINAAGVNKGITVFRADWKEPLGKHINTVEGKSIKKGQYVPSSELQRYMINKVNHIKISDSAYRILKNFDARRVCRHSYTSRNWYCYRWLYRWSDSWRCRLKYRRQTRRICRRYHSIGVIQMLFFKKKPKPTPVEPDTTRIKLYNGAFYPYDSAPSPYRVYTLRDWVEGEDCDFSELAMDCALAILDDYPVVINCLRPTHLKDDFLRNKDTDVIDYLKSISWTDFGWQSSVVTMTNGPDRNLISTQNIDDETILFTFYAYRHLPSEGTLPGTPFVPDVEICFAHLHTRLVITTMNGIEVYADKIRAVCEKYGKTLVVQELPSRANDFD